MIDPAFKFTITLYNKYTHEVNGRNVTEWKRTVLNDCYFGTQTAKQVSGNTLSAADEFICRIPESKAFREDFCAEDGTFTLAPQDIIVKGAVDDEISEVQGQRYTDILNRYRGRAFAVRSVSVNTTLPYAAHYRASGV